MHYPLPGATLKGHGDNSSKEFIRSGKKCQGTTLVVPLVPRYQRGLQLLKDDFREATTRTALFYGHSNPVTQHLVTRSLEIASVRPALQNAGRHGRRQNHSRK
jgi:hypothetical protein